MTILLLVGVLLVLAIAALGYAIFGTATTAAKHYKEDVEHAANTSLVEMFVFIDDKQLKVISIAVLLVIVLAAYFLTQSLIISLASGALVYFLPNTAVKVLKKIRFQKFNNELPDALLSISNMLRSGLNLSGALQLVVNETSGPISQEFGLLMNELTLGRNYEESLDGLYRRVPIPDLQLVVAGMKISREVGGSLADVLERLSDTIRKRIEMEGKIKSLTAMGVLQGVVMSLLPFAVGLAIYAIEPETMSLLFKDVIGWIACAAIVCLEYAGYVMIRKIVTIDV